MRQFISLNDTIQNEIYKERVFMLEGILFIMGTVGIIYVSRASLRAPGSHGFYRFFAWEFLLGLLLLNLRVWFRDPFSWHQLVSWVLLIVSLYLVIAGVVLLRRGKPDARRDDAPLLEMEKTTTLVTEGVYRYIRHPLYSSLFFLGWGAFCKRPLWPAGILALIATLFLLLTAHAEERENLAYFGEAYAAYMRRTKRFVPFLF